VQNALSSQYFRLYTSLDVVGVELGGALKNPIAIAVGIVEGKGMGINTISALVVRGNKELMTLARVLGAHEDTLNGLSGIGDLMLTAFGGLSRNKKVGLRLASGESLQEIMDSSTEVAEGIPTLEVIIELNKELNLYLPLLTTLWRILHGEISVENACEELMNMPLNKEFIKD